MRYFQEFSRVWGGLIYRAYNGTHGVEELTYRMSGKLNNRIIIEKILITKTMTVLDPT